MAQRYPTIKPWLEYHRLSDNEFEVENEIAPGEIDEDPLRLPGYFVAFMQKLDGKTNPYKINPSIDKRTVRAYLRFLSKKGYLRDGIRNRDVGRLAFSVVKFDGKPKYSKTAVLLNSFLTLSWIPVLVCGTVLGVKAWNNYDVFDDTYMIGLLFGLLIELSLHEAGHAIAAKAYQAPVYEIGIRISLIPAAYTLMKETAVKNRLKRTHIYAAGVETNFLLAGLFFAAAYFIPGSGIRTFFFYAGLENILLGVANFYFFLPLDGFKMITTLLGADDMVWSMFIAFIMPSIWKEQLEKGPSGLARMLSVSFLQLTQSIALIWIIYNVAVIFT